MANEVYEKSKKFLKQYPKTIAWRVKKHSNVIQEHMNENELVLYAFAGQKNASFTTPFYTNVIVFTNKRMLMGTKRFLGRYNFVSITPDMLNDFSIRNNILFGEVEIDTVKENFSITCLDKKALPKIEDAISKYMVEEKIKLLKNKK